MKTHKWSDIKKEKLTAAKRAQIEADVRRELLEMDLKTIREALGITQVTLSKMLKLTQAQISRMEKRQDHKISTLTRYVQALGGNIEVRAIFGDKTVRLYSAT